MHKSFVNFMSIKFDRPVSVNYKTLCCSKKQEQNVDYMAELINITMHHSPIKSHQKCQFYDGTYYTSVIGTFTTRVAL